MLRAIPEIEPTFVVGENVSGIVNWNGGMVFEEVQADLEAEGYEVQALLLPASGINAPHHRERCFFVAYPKNYGWYGGECKFRQNNNSKGWAIQKYRQTWPRMGAELKRYCQKPNAPNTEPQGLERQDRQQLDGTKELTERNDTNTEQSGRERSQQFEPSSEGEQQSKPLRSATQLYQSNYWQNFPTQSPLHAGDDGLPTRLDGITFPKWRNESIKGYGNAIVPQVAFQIFKAIEETKKYLNNQNQQLCK
jgi:DNA (cytosine-5)-methyltransferase 1